MALTDLLRFGAPGMKAYRMHSSAMQLRKNGKYQECEEKLDEALKLYDEAYQKGERKFGILSGYAVLLMRKGEFEKAREVMLTASKDKSITPEDRQQLRIDYALCQWKMGRLEKAIETMCNAIGSNKSGSIYNTMAVLLIEQARATGEFEEAIAWNREALDYDDEDAEALDNMAQLNLALSDAAKAKGETEEAEKYRQEALRYFESAWKNKPSQITSAYYYAKMLYEGGDIVKARKVLATIHGIPISAMVQVSKDEVDALEKKLNG
ncbi:MAG: hypothetical protein IJ074_01090, partial [Clostridia bacterium]|nr:hypothetical protein [Clostridia bacterium]